MEKLKIIVLEGNTAGNVIEAQFNPKEDGVESSIAWQRQALHGPGDLSYTGAEPKTMSCELMFDGFSTGTSIQSQIDKLLMLSEPDVCFRRPPKLQIVWGPEGEVAGPPTFDAVIRTPVVKYTMRQNLILGSVGRSPIDARDSTAVTCFPVVAEPRLPVVLERPFSASCSKKNSTATRNQGLAAGGVDCSRPRQLDHGS